MRWRPIASAVVLGFAATVAAGGLWFAREAGPAVPAEAELQHDPLRLFGVVVTSILPPKRTGAAGPAREGEPVPVELTAYCLRGTTRRSNYVREGIVAADPRVFPLGRYVELFVEGSYYGRFLVDDTGRRIKGRILDIWMPTCTQALRFGRQQGTAILVPRPQT